MLVTLASAGTEVHGTNADVVEAVVATFIRPHYREVTVPYATTMVKRVATKVGSSDGYGELAPIFIMVVDVVVEGVIDVLIVCFVAVVLGRKGSRVGVSIVDVFRDVVAVG